MLSRVCYRLPLQPIVSEREGIIALGSTGRSPRSEAEGGTKSSAAAFTRSAEAPANLAANSSIQVEGSSLPRNKVFPVQYRFHPPKSVLQVPH